MDTPKNTNQGSHRRIGLRGPSPGMIAACICLGVMLLVGVVFSPVLTAGFVGQDARHYVFDVGHVRSMTSQEAGATFQRVHSPSGTGRYYQPLTALSLMLDAYATTDWTAGPFQFHLTNLYLHALNVALIFALVHGLSGSLVWSALCALLFGLHPLQVEPVALIGQRMTLLATLFSLLALMCYLRYGRTQHFRWLAAVTLLYAAAILSRPTFIGLPVALLILDVWPLRRATWRPILEKTPLFVLLMACGTMHRVLQSQVVPDRTTGVGGLELLIWNTASAVVRTLWPIDLKPFYPLSEHGAGIGVGMLAGVGIVVGLLIVIVAAFRFSRPVFVAVAGATVLVMPALFDAPFSNCLLGDPYVYTVLIMPIIAWAAWLGHQGNVLRRPWGRCAAMAVASVAMVFSVESYIQSHIWHSNRTLYEHVVALYPKWSPGHVGLVGSFIEESDLDSALYYAEKAVDADPDNPSTQFYLGRVLLLHRDGRSSEAIGPLQKALASDPDWIDCLHNLGVALADTGQIAEAITHLERARDLQPHSPYIRIDLGTAYLQADRPASARREFALALKERNHPIAHLGLAKAWASNDKPELARRHLAAAVARDRRCAVLAAHYPALWRLRHEPGFESLIDASGGLKDGGDLYWAERLPSRSSPGL